MIQKFFLIALIVLLSCIFFLEKRAAYCGVEGAYSPALPYGVKPVWMGGFIWFVDSDGWGLLFPEAGPWPWLPDPRVESPPAYKFKTSNWNEVSVNKISAYSYGAGVYVKVETSHSSVQYAVIDQPNPTRDKIKLFSEDEFIQYLNKSPNDLTWIYVSGKDCGSINFQRFIAYLGVLILSVYLVRTIRKKQDKPK